MRMVVLIVCFAALSFSCVKRAGKTGSTVLSSFNPDSLTIKDAVKLVKGQVLYLPIYSNIPYHEGDNSYNLSAFVAVHNTDLYHDIWLTHVYYFDNDGRMVKDFLQGTPRVLKPLGATNFYIPEKDKSGLGANFILEWISDTLVNEPLIESIMVSLTSGQGVSFLSQGKVIREIGNSSTEKVKDSDSELDADVGSDMLTEQ
jgi:hypothetical protein